LRQHPTYEKVVANMSIRTRIISLAATLLVFLISIAIYSIRQLDSLGSELKEISQLDVPLTQILTAVTVAQLQQSNSFERALRFAADNDNKSSGKNSSGSMIPFEEAKAEYDRLEQSVVKLLAQAENLASVHVNTTTSTTVSLRSTLKRIAELKKDYSIYSEHSREILELLRKGNLTEANVESLVIPGEEEEIRKSLEGLLAEIEKITRIASSRATFIHRAATKESLWIAVIAVIVGIVLALLLTHSITQPLNVALNVAQQIASGNREVPIDINYSAEVGELLQAMVKMRDAINSTEQALRSQAEELRRSNEDLERFAYIASHDLQEPLRMVASYTQLLSKRYKGQLNKDADEFIGFAVEGATRMQQLINDLLTYSRVGRTGGDFGPVSIGDVVAEVNDNLRVLIQENAATFDYENLPQVRGDKSQLVQLFQNIISNAIKFRAAEAPHIVIRAIDEGEMWRFSIEDNGIGMENKYFSRIFEIFQRLHSKDKYPGTGIGLAICKRIIERHNGKIWLASVPDKGTTFYFTLPKV